MNYNSQIHHRRSIRLKGYDYSRAGLYFITICCNDRKCLFGEIRNRQMILNKYGTIAYNEWIKTSEIRNNIELDEFIIMPNHIHGIIILNNNGRGELHSPNNPTTNNINEIHSPNNNLTNIIQGECNSPLRSPSNTIGAIVRGYKSSVTKQLNLLNIGCVVWQRNYYEIIIRDEQSYKNISNYIINNPAKWAADKFNRK
ncbi:MAG: transposase [Bacteroidia bacterium]